MMNFKRCVLIIVAISANSYSAIDFISRYYKIESVSNKNFPTFGWMQNGPRVIYFKTDADSLVPVYLREQTQDNEARPDSINSLSRYYFVGPEGDSIDISSFDFEKIKNDSIYMKIKGQGLTATIHKKEVEGLYLFPTLKQRLPLMIVYGSVLVAPFVLIGFLVF